MKLKAQYDTLDEIPEAYRDLFEERGGVFQLTQIEGMKTDADVNRVQRALTQEKEAHKNLKTEWNEFFGDDKPEDIQSKLDRIEELEAAAGDKIDEDKLEQMVEARVRTKLAPVERERDKAIRERDEGQESIKEFEGKERQRTIHDAVRSAATQSKVRDTAMDDALMLAENMFEVDDEGNVVAKDNVGVTPGVGPDVWLTEMQQKRPHWWPESGGGGAPGSGGGNKFASNPWSKDNWSLTAQGKVVREHGMEKATQMAKSAGSQVGATAAPQ